MRHLLVAAVLLLAALTVTLGAATVLENMASTHQEQEQSPFLPGATPEPAGAPADMGSDAVPKAAMPRPTPPEQSRSLSLLSRKT